MGNPARRIPVGQECPTRSLRQYSKVHRFCNVPHPDCIIQIAM